MAQVDENFRNVIVGYDAGESCVCRVGFVREESHSAGVIASGSAW